MNKQDFLLARAALHIKYVDKLVKYFITALETSLRNIDFVASIYEFTIYNHVDFMTIYKSFNKNIEKDVIQALVAHFKKNGWEASFALSKDEGDERSYIVCNARFLI